MFHVEVNCQCDSTASNNIIGTNDELAYTAERDKRFYLNVANPAPCNGRINSWRYCLYNPGNIDNNREYKTTFAVYREVGTGYQKVTSSETTISLRGREMNRSQNFNCYDIIVDSFTVQAGDFVAACIYDPNGGSTQLDLIGEDVDGSLKWTDWAFSRQCRRNSLPSDVSNNQLETKDSRILHLYATITGRL